MQTKTKDNALLFYPNNFLIETADFDYTELGMYTTLLAIGAQNGFIEEGMMQVVLEYLPAIATKNLEAKFKRDDDGNWQVINTEIVKIKR